MMLTLGIDTAAVTASVALLEEDAVLASITSTNRLNHSVRLLPMIESVYRLAERTLSDTALFAVNAGPGSFTGVRIGVSTVKGLAFETGTPCAPVSATESLAENLCDSGGIICPVMDARRFEFYNALFSAQDGVLTRLTKDRAISGEALFVELTAYKSRVTLVGDGAHLFAQQCPAPNIRLCGAALRLQNAVSVALCGMRMAQRGECVSAEVLSPQYVRQSGAQRKRERKEEPSC